MIDDRTSFLDLPLPNQSNRLLDDVGRIRNSLTEIDSYLGNTTVTNIAALRLTTRGAAIKVSTQGYTASGDGGHGEYWYDSSDTTSSDNGSTVIVAADGGRWKLQPVNGIARPEQFGARLDGVTDDAPAINMAALSGFKVLLSNGIYSIKSQVVIPAGVTVYSNQGMSGAYLDNTNTVTYTTGTIMRIEFGHGSTDYYTDAAIVINDNARLQGVAFWYPNQPLNVNSAPVIYPPAIVTAQGISGAIIADINLGNAYVGIDARRDESGVQIDNIRGYPLMFGIRIGSSTDPSDITRIKFSPLHVLTGTPWVSPNITPWVALNGCMIEIGRLTWSNFDKIWGIAYAVGVDMIDQPAQPTDGINVAGSAQNCNVTNSGFDLVAVGIRGRGFQGRLKISNCDFTPQNFNGNSAIDTWAIDLANEAGAVKNVTVDNVNVWSVAKSAIRLRRMHGSKLTNIHIDGVGELSLGTGVLLDNTQNADISGLFIDGLDNSLANTGVDCINNCDGLKLQRVTVMRLGAEPIRIDSTDFCHISDIRGDQNALNLLHDTSVTPKYNNVATDVRSELSANYTDSAVSSSVLNFELGNDSISYSGTTSFSGIRRGYRGEVVTLRFSAVCTVVDEDAGLPQDNRLYMSGNMTTGFGDTLTLKCYGQLGWYEISRSNN